jgi:hypothetical protein
MQLQREQLTRHACLYAALRVIKGIVEHCSQRWILSSLTYHAIVTRFAGDKNRCSPPSALTPLP